MNNSLSILTILSGPYILLHRPIRVGSVGRKSASAFRHPPRLAPWGTTENMDARQRCSATLLKRERVCENRRNALSAFPPYAAMPRSNKDVDRRIEAAQDDSRSFSARMGPASNLALAQNADVVRVDEVRRRPAVEVVFGHALVGAA